MVKLMKARRPRAVGCYIFAGGFTLGVRRHFEVLGHLEETDYGVVTARHNMPKLPVHFPPETWPITGLSEAKVDFVYGNPPCAAWSVAGYSKTRGKDKWRTDSRVQCTARHFGLLESLRPKVWAWESVTQAFTKGREFVDDLARRALELGYSVTYLLHDTQYLGLPQARKRFFMVCHRAAFSPITPDFSETLEPSDVLKRATKVGEPCPGKDRRTMDCGLGRRFTTQVLAKVRPGQRLSDFWEQEMSGGPPETWERHPHGAVKGRPAFGHCRLPVGKPGGAVVGYAMVHPTQHRFLSTEEMQLLSGYPADYEFTPTSAGARASEIARGVCPPVGAWLAKAVRRAVDQHKLLTKPKVTLYNFLKPGIPAEDLTEVTLGQAQDL